MLVKLPVPVPFEVKLSLIVGAGVVLQHTPRAITLEPPLSVMFPPDTAVKEVTDETTLVLIVAIVAGFVVNITSFPYAVPALFEAYALTWYVVIGCNPVILLVKLPVPIPFEVKLSLIVGDGVVDQQIPRTVIVPSPSSVMSPPDTAVVVATEET